MRKALFPLESHLLGRLERSALAKVLRSRGTAEWLAFRHLQVGMTIPDLVLVRKPRVKPPSRSIRPSRSRLTVFDSWALAELLRYGPQRLDTLAGRLHARAERVLGSLGRLERLDLILTPTRGVYRAARMRSLLSAEVVAVEAKLQRWGEALDQAVSYLSFANRSFIALPEPLASGRETVREACSQAGIGLLAVGVGAPRLVVPARRHEPRSGDWVWLLSKTLGVPRRVSRR